MKLFDKKEISHAGIKELQKEIKEVNDQIERLILKYENGDKFLRKFLIETLSEQHQLIEDLKTVHGVSQ